MSFISINHIFYSYHESGDYVLKDIDLKIDKGESLSLLGPNGAGKTTLLDLILGWKSPTNGFIQIHNKNSTALSRKEAGKIMSLVPQFEHMNFSFSLFDYVLFGRTPYLQQLGIPNANDLNIVEESLKTVGLLELRNRSIQELSGGETQLLLLARSIAQQPEILLLDEPTSDLDPGNMGKVLSILSYLSHEKGTTLIFTTHDPNLASELSSKTALIKQGCLNFYGKTSEGLTSKLLSDLYSISIETAQIGDRKIIYRR